MQTNFRPDLNHLREAEQQLPKTYIHNYLMSSEPSDFHISLPALSADSLAVSAQNNASSCHGFVSHTFVKLLLIN